MTYVALVDQANTKLHKASPTISSGDWKVSIDGGTLNNLATLPTNTPASSVMVKISLSAAEMTGDVITVVGIDASGAEWASLVLVLSTVTNQFDSLATQASVNTIDDFLDTEMAAVLAAVDTEVAAIKAKTDNLPAAPAAVGDIPTVVNILAGVVEGTRTVKGALRLMLSVLSGRSNGGGTVTVSFRDEANTKNRVQATVDTSGNRSVVVLDDTD